MLVNTEDINNSQYCKLKIFNKLWNITVICLFLKYFPEFLLLIYSIFPSPFLVQENVQISIETCDIVVIFLQECDIFHLIYLFWVYHFTCIENIKTIIKLPDISLIPCDSCNMYYHSYHFLLFTILLIKKF